MVECKGNPIRQNDYVSGGVIKIGDFVTQNAAGQVVVAAASQALCGVANSPSSAAGQIVKVWDHPDQLFNVSRSAVIPSALTDYNQNFNIVAATSTSQESNHTLDSASGATTATLPLKALRPSQDSATLGTASRAVICIINNHQLKGGTGSAGV